MKKAEFGRYEKKSKQQLLKDIDECSSLSQLFALIQHEDIVIQMHTQSDASNIKPQKLDKKKITAGNDLPFERLKSEVRKAVEQNSGNRSKPKQKDNSRIIEKLEECNSLSELFDFIKKENIVIHMHSQTGASNLVKKKLEPKINAGNSDTPFERLKAEVRNELEKNEDSIDIPVKKSNNQLLRELDECETLSQLLEMIRHDNIEIQLYGKPDSSYLKAVKQGDKTDKKFVPPFEKLKSEVRKVLEKEEN